MLHVNGHLANPFDENLDRYIDVSRIYIVQILVQLEPRTAWPVSCPVNVDVNQLEGQDMVIMWMPSILLSIVLSAGLTILLNMVMRRR